MDSKRVRPAVSHRIAMEGLTNGEDSFLVDARYDRIDMFRFIGSAIMRIAMEEGIAHMLVDEATGDRVAQHTGIPLIEFDYIFEPDYEMYLRHQDNSLSDDWLI